MQAGGLPVRRLYVAHCGNACAEPQWQRRATLVGFEWNGSTVVYMQCIRHYRLAAEHFVAFCSSQNH